jgi:hypothetical protein
MASARILDWPARRFVWATPGWLLREESGCFLRVAPGRSGLGKAGFLPEARPRRLAEATPGWLIRTPSG